MERTIEIRLRPRVYIDGRKFFGLEHCELLAGIEQTGSIAKAAKNMNLSYKTAWVMINDMNAHGKSPYVVKQTGGINGGGALLTDTGKKVLLAYQTMNEKLLAIIKAEQELFLTI